MHTLQSLKCQGCGGGLTCDIFAGKIACEHCGTVEAVPPAGGGIALGEEPVERLLELEQAEPLAKPEGMRVISCRSCGAEASVPAQLRVVDCAFCASTAVHEEAGGGRWFRPAALLPFQVRPEEAQRKLKAWARQLRWRPDRVQRLDRPEELTAMYLPFWTFDAWANAEFEGWRSGTVSADGESHSGRVAVDGRRRAQYVDLLVCASQGVPLECVRGIEPFSTLNELIAYDPRLLAGGSAELSSVGVAEAWRRAEEHLCTVEYDKACSDVRLAKDESVHLNIRYKFEDRRGKPVLLPVYVASYRYAGKTYRVLVNGETGRVEGQAPYSWWKLAALALVVLPLFGLLNLLFFGTPTYVVLAFCLVYGIYQRVQASLHKRKAVASATVSYGNSVSKDSAKPRSWRDRGRPRRN